MSQTIMMADQMGGYALSDRATWLAMKEKAELSILSQGDKTLFNPYANDSQYRPPVILRSTPRERRHSSNG